MPVKGKMGGSGSQWWMLQTWMKISHLRKETEKEGLGRKISDYSAVLKSLSQDDRKTLRKDCLSEEPSITQKLVSTRMTIMLSHWLRTSPSKYGLCLNTLVDRSFETQCPTQFIISWQEFLILTEEEQVPPQPLVIFFIIPLSLCTVLKEEVLGHGHLPFLALS